MLTLRTAILLLLCLNVDALVTSKGWTPRQQQLTAREASGGVVSSAKTLMEDPLVWGVALGAAAMTAGARMMGSKALETVAVDPESAQGSALGMSANDYLLEVAVSRARSTSKMDLPEDGDTSGGQLTAYEFMMEVAARRAASASKMELDEAPAVEAEEKLSANDFLLQVAASRAASSSKMTL